MGGLQRHQARQEALQDLGRALARRAKSRCELCQDSGVPLRPLEVPPAPAQPDLERTLLLCSLCADALLSPLAPPGERWRVLETAIWSELLPVKVCAARLLARLSLKGQQAWAAQCLDAAYLDDEALAWIHADA